MFYITAEKWSHPSFCAQTQGRGVSIYSVDKAFGMHSLPFTQKIIYMVFFRAWLRGSASLRLFCSNSDTFSLFNLSVHLFLSISSYNCFHYSSLLPMSGYHTLVPFLNTQTGIVIGFLGAESLCSSLLCYVLLQEAWGMPNAQNYVHKTQWIWGY